MEIEYQAEYRYQVRLYLKCEFSFIGKKKKRKEKKLGRWVLESMICFIMA